MNKWQSENIKKAEEILISVYWDMKDNRDSEREVRLLDTILGKLYQLQNLENE